MKFVRSMEIGAPPELLFDLTQDYVRRLEWDPFLSAARLIGTNQPAKGAIAKCDDRRGLSMEVVYVSYQRPDVAAVMMTRGPFFLASFAGSWRFAPTPEAGITRVTFKYYYVLRRWCTPFAGPIDRLFTQETDERLTALRDFCRARGADAGTA